MSTYDAGLLFRCGRCGAREGQACATRSGRRATYQHAARWEAVMEVVRASGWLEEADRERARRVEMWRDVRRLLVAASASAEGVPEWVLTRLHEIGEWK